MSESTDIMELLGRRCCHVIAAVAGLALIASSERVWSGAFVYDSGAYFSAAGDVDGDGLEDVIILDKASGACRVGLGRVDGGFGFGDPMASGVPNVEGLAVGKLIEVGRDAVAVSGFAANRVHVLSPVDTLFNELGNVAAAGSVPGPLAALDVPSSGTAGLDDLVVYSFGRAETQVLKNLAGSFTEIGSFSSGGEVRDTNPVLLSAGGAQHLGYFPVGGSTKYRIAKSVSGAVIPWFDSVELPDGSLAIWVGTRDFPESEFLFFAPGGSAVTVQRINSGEDGFLAPRGFDLGADISQMYRLPGLSGDRVLVQFGDGVLEVFDFGSATGFESAGVIDGGTVDRATGVVPLSDGRIVSIFGDADDGAFQVFEREGDGYVASGGVNDLPAAFVHGFSGNLFYFDGVPLLDEAPALLGQRRVADWTVAITGGGAGGVTVVGESFLGVESGLGGEGAVATGQPAPGTVGILVNQVRSDISVASLPTTPAVLGDGTVGLRISPPGGRYDVSIEVVIAPVVAGDKVFLRRDGVGAFVEPVGPLPLFTDGWIEAYAESLDGERRTAVQRVDYHFRTQPEEQDADGDGVPDFVEVAKGTPVSGGGDSDGDGTGDLEELLAGNDPADPDDHPDLESDPRRETAARLVARLTPRPWNASLGAASFARRSTAVRGYSVEGGLLGVGAVEFDGSSFEASLILEPLDVRQRFFSVATEPHFDITAAPVGPVIGRELVALLGVPEIQPIDILYAFDAGGDLQGEASDWVEAAVTAYGETAPSEVVREITVVDTLVLALVEAKLRQVLNVRGTVPPEQTVSLLPYRSPEFDPSLYRHLDNTDLDALATVTKDELASGWEAVRIRAL